MDLDEYRRDSQDVWERMARGWEERRDWMWEASRAVGEWMVAKLAPAPGSTVLELAAGPGDTGFAAAARLGDDGRLISTDFSPQMVEVARRRAGELGLENVEFRVMDAERMDLDDDSVDGVLCRWGYMLMADPAAALRETRRVLRDGGRVAFSVWAAPERNLWAFIPGRVMIERGHMPPPEPGAPGIFALADPDRTRELVTGAGFDDPELEIVEMTYTFDSFDQYWDFLVSLAGALAMKIATLSEDEREAVREAVRDALGPLEADGGYRIGGACLNAAAV